MSGLLGSITVEQFLQDYWQQKPLLVRQALPDFESPVTPDELAGLACETDTARIVIEKGGNHPWEVRHGAFAEEEFTNLPSNHWTLLVNDADLHLPELKEIIEPFRFIPDWRIDDLMISFAVQGGSVGPHVDEYDVFLIQAQGKRRWQISNQTGAQHDFIPEVELRIMQNFQAEQEWVLEPGDMLYLPPNVPHYGVALDDCMTYSVGFRAPSQADMLQSLLEDLLGTPRLQQRFSDKQRKIQNNPGELSIEDTNELLNLMNECLNLSPQTLRIWLGKFLTQPRVNPILEMDTDPSISELHQVIEQEQTLYKFPTARLAYFLEKDAIFLFTNGNLYKLPLEASQLVQHLCAHPTLTFSNYKQFLNQLWFSQTIDKLLQKKVFFTQ